MKKLLGLAALSVFLLSQQGAMAKGAQLIPGSEAHDRVADLTSEISWYHSLPQAEQAARAQHKMVFWVQMLGDISGAT